MKNGTVSDYSVSEGLYQYLKSLEVESMTPIEAMNALFNIVSTFNSEK
jgi:hypothetical protein